MPPPVPPGSRPASNGARLFQIVGLCVGLTWAPPAFSQAPEDGSAFGGLMEGLGLKAKPTRTPAFVRKSRPGEGSLHYMPVGEPRGAPATKTMTPAEVAAATDALDSARMAQQRRAGVKAAPVPLKAAKGSGQPKAMLR